jgi:ribosomal protein S18 acetylase RimI-like enzyme
MRPADRRECEALGRSPKDALRNGLRCSLEAYTAIADGRPVAMLGVVADSLVGGSATVWMLGTEDVYRQGRTLLTLGPILFEMWLEQFDELSNIVAVDNRRAIRLLERWGFEFGQTVSYGGVDFVRFARRRSAIQEVALAA